MTTLYIVSKNKKYSPVSPSFRILMWGSGEEGGSKLHGRVCMMSLGNQIDI